MNDASDWADQTCAAEPGRRGRLTLGLVLVLVAVVGVLAYVGLELGAKVVRFASAFSVHTVHSKSSPAGGWTLVIDTVDEGALGGSTNVYLKPARGDARDYALYEDDWLPDSAVRWRDARTVSIDGLLQMPFVERAIATGSSGTEGAALDASGYVHNVIAPGERVVLLSGLSLVLPGATAGSCSPDARQLARVPGSGLGHPRPQPGLSRRSAVVLVCRRPYSLPAQSAAGPTGVSCCAGMRRCDGPT